jgi:hypothetical protein
VPLLASVPGIARVCLIDFDEYESGNLGLQPITPRDLGRAKAKVQARIMHTIRPDLDITAYVCRFENLPLGILRGNVILSCVDSRAARQAINRTAFALGTPWIDAALAREGSVRARIHLPGRSACLECGWGLRDYELLEQRLPCAGADSAPAATAAAPELGAIAAGLQISLCRRLVADAAETAAVADRQFFLDVSVGRGWTGVYAPNPTCRLDHSPWAITVLERGSIDMPMRDALALAGTEPAETALSAPGQVFVRRLRCPRCPNVRQVRWRLSGRLAKRLCDACGVSMLSAVMDTETQLTMRNASAAVLQEPLARRGFVAGDLVSVGSADAARYFQLA